MAHARSIIVGLILSLGAYYEEAAATRRSTARAEFQRIAPCPSTGKRRGPCPGYVVDHITAIACGGLDHPSNMQWQTVPEAKAKDRWERIGCQPALKSK